MKLIDRYVYTVVRRLPESMRAGVEAELRARIADLLSGDGPSGERDEGAVREALKAVGNPILLADQYRGGPRVLIGPDTYEIYLCVLRIALIVVACAVPAAVFLEGMLKGGWQGIESLATVLGRMLSSGIVGVIQAFAWVTVVFAVLDKTKAFRASWPYTGKEWTVDDLDDPAAPGAGGRGKSEKIGYIGPALSIAFTVLGVVFLWRFAALLGWYEIGDGEILVTPFFAPEILRKYLPFIAASALLQMAVSACLLISQTWTRAVAGLNLLVNALSTALVLVMVNDFRLVSPQFIITMAGHLDIQAAKLSEYWQWGIMGLSVLVVFAFLGEIFQSIRRLR